MKPIKITFLHVVVLLGVTWISAALHPYWRGFEVIATSGIYLFVLMIVYLFLPKRWKQ